MPLQLLDYFLTTAALITDKPQPKSDAPPMGGGGMPPGNGWYGRNAWYGRHGRYGWWHAWNGRHGLLV